MSSQPEIFPKYLAKTNPWPIGLEIDRAEGVYIYEKSGKIYLDMIAGVAVSNLGHGHPKVIQAVKAQVEQSMHTMVYGEFVYDATKKFALKLTSVLPKQLNGVYFVNSGAEANEGALKLAKRLTGKTEIISMRGAYHGSTHGALSVSGNEHKKQAFRPLLPGVRFIRFNEPKDLSQITEKTAAVIIETVQGDAGVRVPQKEYLQALREKCHETGAQLIFDEIQCGMGRTGKLFAFEHFEVIPDILTLGKALGGGMPIGAFVSSQEKIKCLAHNPMLGHITTFGGHPVICAAGLAALNVLLEENHIEGVEEKGRLIKALLQHQNVKEIRQIGLMLAVELESAEKVEKLFHHCLENGVIGFWFLSQPQSFRLAPPLVITEDEIKKACAVIVAGLDKL